MHISNDWLLVELLVYLNVHTLLLGWWLRSEMNRIQTCLDSHHRQRHYVEVEFTHSHLQVLWVETGIVMMMINMCLITYLVMLGIGVVVELSP
ncbi:MAG: hypothetical protein HY565_02850 [Candidatus Kerfeldbacteria bacterium]|nr:hypothetical protein [Candidatus Kerfeldbacteria bacterium]